MVALIKNVAEEAETILPHEALQDIKSIS